MTINKDDIWEDEQGRKLLMAEKVKETMKEVRDEINDCYGWIDHGDDTTLADDIIAILNHYFPAFAKKRISTKREMKK